MQWVRSNLKDGRLRDALVFLLCFGAAIVLSLLLSRVYDDNNQFSVPVFILVVSLVARFTRGYGWGILASFAGVFCVNYMFTYPFFAFNFRIPGYPLTFAAMLIVSVLISTLTSRVKQQEQLRLEVRMEQMRANLLRSVSHDLRTPLTSIIGISSVLCEEDTLPEEEQRELLREIEREARWLVRITENILSVTRVTGDAVRLHKKPEVVEEVVAGAILKFRRNNQIPVAVDKPEEILLAPMDATLIEQVLVNLFDNAAAHGKSVQRIRVTIGKTEDGVRVSVSDDGVGIPSAILPRVFEGQLAMSGSHSDTHRHMGIGLSVCRSIIQAHGGSIYAKNNTTGGACITFELPAGEEDQDGC